MPLFAVLPVVQQIHSPPSSVPHSHNPVPNPKDPFASLSAPMVGKSSQRRPANTTPPPSHAALSSAALSGTPHSRGSGSRTHHDDPSRVAENLCGDYDKFLAEDLAHNRVYISFDNALQNILHVPSDWGVKTHEYQKIIADVSEHPGFIKKRQTYLNICDKGGSIEPDLYIPQAELYNVAIQLINKFSGTRRKRKEELLHFKVNHPQGIVKGIFTAGNGLSPDLMSILEPLENETSFIWPMIMHVEEMKGSDATLDTGKNSPRARNKGEKDPLSERRSPARAGANTPKEPEVEAGSANKKRKLPTTQSASRKSARTSQKASSSTRPDDAPPTSTPDNKTSTETRLQCARYLMEMLEYSILRSHAFLTLVDRDRLQLMYADRSAIVTSSIIDLRTDDGLKMFLAMLIAFHHLTPQQWGFLSLVRNPFPTTPCRAPTADKDSWLEGLTMQLRPNGSPLEICLTLGKVLYHQPGIIGRGTCVIEAECEDPQLLPKEWTNMELVVKVSWPGMTRRSEIDLLECARRTATELLAERMGRCAALLQEAKELRRGDNIDAAEKQEEFAKELIEEDKTHWALKHLPNILHSQDLSLDATMPQTKLALFFKSAEYINGHFEYEERTARTTVQEKLLELTLTTPAQSAQAFYDVLMCHRWLHQKAEILHRDISAGNIMYRVVEGKTYGVLNDLDLSSLRKDVEEGRATSFQRTGTPPYMAIELLQNSRTTIPPVLHLYRHDLESLAYVMLMHCSRYKFNPNTESVERRDNPPFDDWFNPKLTWKSLSEKKYTFVMELFDATTDIHPTFEAFAPWLEELLFAFQKGFQARNDHIKAMNAYNRSLNLPAKTAAARGPLAATLIRPKKSNILPSFTDPGLFDDETLGGHVLFDDIADSFLNLGFGETPLEFRSKDI